MKRFQSTNDAPYDHAREGSDGGSVKMRRSSHYRRSTSRGTTVEYLDALQVQYLAKESTCILSSQAVSWRFLVPQKLLRLLS